MEVIVLKAVLTEVIKLVVVIVLVAVVVLVEGVGGGRVTK